MVQSSGANNLTIGIGVDSSKLPGELARATAIYRDWLRQLNAAAKQEMSAGRTPLVDQLSAGAAAAAAQIAKLKQQQRDLRQESSEGATKLTGDFKSLASGIATIVESWKAVRFGIAGAVIFEAIRKIGEAVTDVTNKVTQLNKIAAATGFDTSTIQAFEHILKSTGGVAEDAGKILFALSRSYDAARLAAERAGQTLGSGMQILRGGGPDQQSGMQVFRGGEQTMRPGPHMVTVQRGASVVAPPEIKDATSAYDALNIKVARYNNSLQDQDKLLVDVAKGLKAWKDAGRIDVATEIGTQLVGKNYREIAAALDEIAKPGTLARIRDLQKATGQLISPEDKKLVDDYTEAHEALTSRAEGGQTRGVMGALPAVTAAAQKSADALQELKKTPQEIADAWQQTGESITEGSDRVVGNLKQAWGDLGAWFDNLGAGIANRWNAQMGTMAAPPAGGGGGGITGGDSALTEVPFGMASGGYVRGPGSGTSDSIAARLSAGEFVVRAAAVRRLGLGFLSGLNGYAAGGLVERPPLRFAAGGLVPSAAGGGRAVHLHLGGGSFALSGHGSVVDALVSAAHSQQIRSAGVKPSWFAARPGGQ